MHLHGDNLEAIYDKVISKEILPSEYLPDEYDGPSAGTLQEINGKGYSVLTLFQLIFCQDPAFFQEPLYVYSGRGEPLPHFFCCCFHSAHQD